jgi:hypothetical protein
MKNQILNQSKLLVISLTITMLLLVYLKNASWAQIPANLSYQGCLRNNNGDPQTGSFNLLFKIYESESSGTAIWEENHIGVQVDNGYFNVTLGGLNQIPFNKQYWLGISVNGGQELSPRSRLTSVAYSLNTKSINLPYAGITNSGDEAFYIKNTNGASGVAARFEIENTSNTGECLYVKTNGYNCQALVIKIDNSNSIGSVIRANTNGKGAIAWYQINNSSNESYGLKVSTNGLGEAGVFEIDNGNNDEPALYAATNGNGNAIEGRSYGSGYAGRFYGNVLINNKLTVGGDLRVDGTLSKSAGTFEIDHPLDPENKILRHSFAESPEMMNLYKGRAKLENGKAEIKLPDYFDALNHPDGREINLTPVNGWSPLFLEGEIKNNQFVIKTTKEGNPEQEFSWIIYAVRNDEYARNHPIIVEEEKGINNRFKKGEYLNSSVNFEK